MYHAPNLSSPTVSAQLAVRSGIVFRIQFDSLNTSVSSNLELKLPFSSPLSSARARDPRLRVDGNIDHVPVIKLVYHIMESTLVVVEAVTV